MDWIQQWQSKLNKQNGVAPLVRTGGSRHTGLAALPYRNIHAAKRIHINLVLVKLLELHHLGYDLRHYHAQHHAFIEQLNLPEYFRFDAAG